MSRIKGRDFNYYMNIAFSELNVDQVSCGSDGSVELTRYTGDINKRFENKREFISWVTDELKRKNELTEVTK